MLSRLIAGMIVVFWVGMMTALVRLEFFPAPAGVGDVPSQLVLRKIFSYEDDTRLNVSYQGRDIGFCKLEIEPLTARDTAAADGPGVAPVIHDGYRVRSELTLTLALMGTPSHLRLVGDSLFNPDYEIESFHLRTQIGEGRVELRGDAESNQVLVDFQFGQIRDQRVFDFDQVEGAGLASAMGLPGLANFSFLGGGGMPGGFGRHGSDPSSFAATTTIHLADLRLGTVVLRTYLVESRLEENLWARMWVSERGEVLKVETSFGLTMLADVLSSQTLGPPIQPGT